MAVLLILFFAGMMIRVQLFKDRVDYDPADGTGFFWTESAFHYRYANMIARGLAIPDNDPLVQYPRGLRIWENETPVMEYLDGTMYRLLQPGVPLHVFLIYAMSFTTCLGIVAAYGAAAEVWRDRRAGLLAAALYAVAMPTISRIIPAYAREHLSLPLLFFNLWGLLAALRLSGERAPAWRPRTAALLAGAALGLGLASWHVSRFYLLIQACCLAATWLYLLFTDESGAERYAGVLAWMLPPVLAAAFASPLLRSQRFFLSPAIALLISLPLAAYAGRSLPPLKKAGAWLLLFAILAVGAAALSPGQEGAYSHVWALMKAKIMHFGIKPEDPSRLPFEARLMWIEDFRSPDPGLFLFSYGSIPLLAGFGVAAGLRNRPWKEWGGPAVLMLLLTASFVALFLLMQRMTGFLVFFLILLAAGLAVKRTAVVLALLVCCWGFEAHKFMHYGRPTAFLSMVNSAFPPRTPAVPNWRVNDLSFLNWIRLHTTPDDVVLARFGTSPVILAYTERPVIIQSKTENRDVRERIQGFMENLYRSEEDFYRYCAENRAAYFVFEAPLALDDGDDAERYTAGQRDLRRDSAAYLFHFHPGRLKRFTLLFQNTFYRIYAVKAPGRTAYDRLPYQPTFDPALFGPEEGEFFSDTMTPRVMARLETAVQLYTTGISYANAGRVPDAIRYFESAMQYHSGLIGLHADLGVALARAGRSGDAVRHLREEVRLYPDSVPAYYSLGQVLASMGDYLAALQEWEMGLARDPRNAALLDSIRRVRMITGGAL